LSYIGKPNSFKILNSKSTGYEKAIWLKYLDGGYDINHRSIGDYLRLIRVSPPLMKKISLCTESWSYQIILLLGRFISQQLQSIRVYHLLWPLYDLLQEYATNLYQLNAVVYINIYLKICCLPNRNRCLFVTPFQVESCHMIILH